MNVSVRGFVQRHFPASGGENVPGASVAIVSVTSRLNRQEKVGRSETVAPTPGENCSTWSRSVRGRTQRSYAIHVATLASAKRQTVTQNRRRPAGAGVGGDM